MLSFILFGLLQLSFRSQYVRKTFANWDNHIIRLYKAH